MSFKKREFPKTPKSGNIFDIRVFVATPAYDGRVLTDYAMSMAESCLVSPINGVYVMASVMGNGAFIDIARNHFVRMFMESDSTHLFFIDADLRWEPRAFVELAKSGKPFVAGAYPKRQDPEEYPVRFIADTEGNVQTDKGWVLADRVPTGFMCIRRDVIERMIAERPTLLVGNDPECPKLFYEKFEPVGDGTERMIGEDYAFCDDYVRIFKQPIHVWPDFNFIHGSRFKGNFHQWLLKKSQEAGAQAEVSSAA